MAKYYKVGYAELKEFSKTIFKTFGLIEEEAEIVADTMVEANLRGIHTHGVMRIGIYLERLEQGGTAFNTKGTVVSETPTTALIDGNNGIGAFISEQAVTLARQKAMHSNVAFVSVKSSNHFGTCAYWAQKLAGDDMIGFAGSNVEPLMPAAGGRAPTIGNNPFSIAVPTGKYRHLCLDMACSIVAAAKKFEYQLRNEQMPLGWFVDKDGNPTTDPSAAAMVLPFGGYKGYIIAVAVEVLTSLLSGGNFGRHFGSQYEDVKNPNHTSHYFAAIKISAIRELHDFKESVDKYIEYLRSIPTLEGVPSVLYPGEIEEKNRKKSLKEGILLPANLVDELCVIADSVGVAAKSYGFLMKDPTLQG